MYDSEECEIIDYYNNLLEDDPDMTDYLITNNRLNVENAQYDRIIHNIIIENDFHESYKILIDGDMISKNGIMSLCMINYSKKIFNFIIDRYIDIEHNSFDHNEINECMMQTIIEKEKHGTVFRFRFCINNSR